MAKCPHCDQPIGMVKIEETQIFQPSDLSGKWRGILYTCPSCDKVLTVAIDPIAMQADLVTAIKRSLR